MERGHGTGRDQVIYIQVNEHWLKDGGEVKGQKMMLAVILKHDVKVKVFNY